MVRKRIIHLLMTRQDVIRCSLSAERDYIHFYGPQSMERAEESASRNSMRKERVLLTTSFKSALYLSFLTFPESSFSLAISSSFIPRSKEPSFFNQIHSSPINSRIPRDHHHHHHHQPQQVFLHVTSYVTRKVATAGFQDEDLL